VLIDTAGIRRRSKVDQWVEKFSIVKTLQAIHDAHVVVFIIDGRQGLVDQDLHLLGLVLKAGRAMVLAVNKWDGLAVDERTSVRQQLDRRLTFLSFANRHFISALQGSGINQLYGSIKQAYASATQPLATPELTAILQQLVSEHQPPMIQGRRIKLRYAHSGGHCPPTIVIHGKQTDKLPAAYRRYLINSYQQALQLQGTPVRLVLRTDDNPYQPSTSKTSGKKKSNKK
jgi:GTP-binding protein